MSRNMLKMVVLNDWVMEGLRSLGSGNMYHLSYHPSLIDPIVLEQIRTGEVEPAILIQVILHQDDFDRKIAEGELIHIADFNDYIRFEFRILSVVPFLRNGTRLHPEGYLCWFDQA